MRFPGRVRDRATWWVLFLVLVSITVLWALSIPMMGAPDEPTHVTKAVAVANGDFSSKYVRKHTGGLYIRSIPQTNVRVPIAYAQLNRQVPCWQQSLEVPVSCAPTVSSDETEVTARTYVGGYPPLYYVMTGWASRVFAPYRAIYMMRITTGIVCAALLATGLMAAARLGRGRMALVGATLGATPMAIFMAGAVNPSGVEIAAAFCLWPSLLALVTESDRAPTRSIVRAVVAAVVLAAVRPLSPAFVVAIVVMTWLLVGSRATFQRLWADTRIRVAGGVVAVVTVLAAVQVLVSGSLSAQFEFADSGDSRFEVARRAFELTGARVEEAIGVLSWTGPAELHLPSWLVTGWILAVLAMVVGAVVVGRWRERVVLLVLTVGCLAVPILAQASSEYGTAWQGRYGLPLLIGVPLLAGWIIDDSRRLARTAELAIGTAVPLFVGAAYLVAHQRVMTRSLVGLPHSLFAGLSDGVWKGPGSPVVLFTWALAASLAYAVLLISLTWGPWLQDRAEAGRPASDAGAVS